MNDQTPLRLEAATALACLTPAGLQDSRVLARRRWIMAGLVMGTISLFGWGFVVLLGSDGWTWLDIGIFVSYLLGTPWTVIGLWNAVIGFWLLHGAKNPLAKAAPHMVPPPAAKAISLRTAVLMTLRNEDPVRAFLRLRILRNSIEATGRGGRFDYFILSDTSDAAIAAEEETLFAGWQAEFADTSRNPCLIAANNDTSRTHYRRRAVNDGFKAGNLRDFMARWGANYDLMLPLDADSLMSGAEIVKLVAIIEAHPRIGILQSLVTGTPSTSAFARFFQFGMRHAMRSYTIGNAWWNGDCGPYWGHNALIRIAQFYEACELPVLPGKAPLGGWVLSHDLIESTLMRRHGYEVRVAPVEGQSWEDNPPTLLDFTKRDLRWCQGNMQYWRLLGLPGILPFSRYHIALGILMYLGSLGWTVMMALSALKVFDPPMGKPQIALGISLFAASFVMSLAPKLAGMLDVAVTPGGLKTYGGGLRFMAGVMTEIVFSMLLAPVAAVRVSIFMVSLLFGRSVIWGGQQRDTYSLSWATACQGLWPQTLFGLALFGLLAWRAPGALPWAAPLLAGLTLAIPFAVLTASPRFGRMVASIGLCATPEELDTPPELIALGKGEPMHSLAQRHLSPSVESLPPCSK